MEIGSIVIQESYTEINAKCNQREPPFNFKYESIWSNLIQSHIQCAYLKSLSLLQSITIVNKVVHLISRIDILQMNQYNYQPHHITSPWEFYGNDFSIIIQLICIICWNRTHAPLHLSQFITTIFSSGFCTGPMPFVRYK